MACHSVLVAIITAYLSAIAFGTPINIPPNNSLILLQDDQSTNPHINLNYSETSDVLIPSFVENSTLTSISTSTEENLTTDGDKQTTLVKDTANINDAQNSTESNVRTSTITTSSTSITTSSLISTTTSIGTSTLPPDQLHFTAVWQTDEDGLDYIMVQWSEKSHVNATQPIEWKLLASRESESQSLIIRSTCSWHNNSRRHQVKLEKESQNYRVSCNDNTHHEDLVFIKPCLSYDLLLFIPLPGKDQLIGRTKLKPLIKWPSKIESSYNVNDKKIVIHWEPPYRNLNCSVKYHYDLFVDKANSGNISKTIGGSRIEHPAEFCTDYSISVWSIIVDGSNETISNQPIRHANRTEMQDFDMTDMNVNAQAINETCVIFRCFLNDNFRYIVGCGVSLRILLDPPSEEKQDSWITCDNQQQMICHLRPGTEYKVSVEFKDHQGIGKYSPHAIVSTASEYNTVTVGLIVLSSLLVLLLLGVSLYCILPWFTRYHRRSNGENQSVRLKSSFFGNMGRRRSHPIKLRNLNAVTQRLCSSAGHLLEMEFEDLVIIADARRPKDSPIALLQENAIKNRYVNILPYEHNCVPLSLLPDSTDSNYINASYIMGFNDPREYIATQGPKICTIEDFWRMVWEQNVYIIIMVTSLEERGKPKCDRYWPEDADNPLTFDSLSVSQLNETDFENYTLRSFKVERNGKSRTVKQAYLKGWPDFGVPNNPEILIRFIEVVRVLVNETSTSQTSSSLQPIVVHCSAGVGRTGTFIAVDWLMQEARVEKEIDIFSTILRMRECRLNMVQSEEQYEYIYRCMSHFVNTRLFATVEQSCDAATFLTNGNNPLLNELE